MARAGLADDSRAYGEILAQALLLVSSWVEAKPINLLFGLVARDIDRGVRWSDPAADLAKLKRKRRRRRQLLQVVGAWACFPGCAGCKPLRVAKTNLPHTQGHLLHDGLN